jgi:hypothetical protein
MTATKVTASAEGLAHARQFTRCHLLRRGLEEIVDDDVTRVMGELSWS